MKLLIDYFWPSKIFSLILFLIYFSCVARAMGATIEPTSNNLPNSVFSGSDISGNNIYSQIAPKGPYFTINGGNLTLTGNTDNGNLLTGRRNVTVSLNSQTGNTTLRLFKGTLDARGIRLGTTSGDSQTVPTKISYLLTGNGSGNVSGSVTINGMISGATDKSGTKSIIQTDGSSLIINGKVADQGWIGELRAWNGNITIATSSSTDHTHVDTISVHRNQTVNINNRLVVSGLDLQPGATVTANFGDLYNQISNNGDRTKGMQAGSLFKSATSILFRKSSAGSLVATDGGINGASGTIRAELDIDGDTFDLLQGNGSLTLSAGGSIITRGDITADTVEAGTTIFAKNLSGKNTLHAGGDISVLEKIKGGDVSAGRNITAKTISGKTISAGNNITADTISGAAIHVGGSFVNAKTITGTTSISGDHDVMASERIAGGAVSAVNNIIAPAISGSSISAGNDIVARNISGGAVEAKRDISTINITANSAKAGRNLIAGTAPVAGQIRLQSANKAISPTGTIIANNISAPLVAAGELKSRSGASSRVEAANMLIVKNEGDAASTGNFTLRNGSFAFSGTNPVGNAEYRGDGSIIAHNEAAWIGGDMSVNNNAKSSFTSLGVKGMARIAGGELSGEKLNASSARLHNGIEADIANLNLVQSGGSLQIGSQTDTAPKTVARISRLFLNGGDLQVGAGTGLASAAIERFVGNGGSGNQINGDITVGHNGLLALGGGSPAHLESLATAAGMDRSAAVLGVFSPMIAAGALNADSAWSMPEARRAKMGRAARQIGFSYNSFLAIDGGAAGVNYGGSPVPTAKLAADAPGAISAATPAVANVQSGAKIYIDRVTPGHTYVALGRNIQTVYEDDTAWNGTNLQNSNPLLGLERLGDGMEGQFSVVEKAKAAKVIGVTSGVPRMARSASETMEDAIYHRIRLGHEDLYRRNFALWALPIYESISHFGFDGGEESYGYRGGLGGIAIGADYTWQNTLRTGIALNMGAGYAQSTGELETTRNNLNFWGAGVYGVWKPGDFSLDADVNFTSVYNKIRQELSDDFAGSEIKADIPAWSLGMGLRAQYEIVTDWITLRPHAGARYFHLETSPYDMSLNGQDVIRSYRAYQNVWTFPFGIVFTHNFKLDNGYEITPLVNLKAIPASGDIYMKNAIRYAGSHKDMEFDTQVMDAITWGGRAGVEFRAGDFTAGINYTAQFGSHTSNQGVFGVLRYEF